MISSGLKTSVKANASTNSSSTRTNTKATTTSRPTEYLSGLIERITYHNLENGFCVLRVQVKGKKDLVTVTGNSPSLSPGEHIKCSGSWHNDRNHGLQFKADFLKSFPPDTLEGIEKYLGSGLIKGIGPHFAKILVSTFKEKVLDVIENEPQLLLSAPGIGKIRVAKITSNWKDQKIIREIMIFLQSHGVGTTRATRIYKTYGEQAIKIVSENPYRLAKDIRGIGFISADSIASNLGIAKNSLIRARAGTAHVLLEATSEGNCGLPIQELIVKSQKLLEIEEALIIEVIEHEIKEQTLTRDKLLIGGAKDTSAVDAVFLTSYYVYEKTIAKLLLQFVNTEPQHNTSESSDIPKTIQSSEKLIDKTQTELGITLASSQKDAIVTSLATKVMVITGGPGTGKTTLVKSLLHVLKLQNKDYIIKLCAPTGRAAKRLSESTQMEAITVHRLLEIDPSSGGFKRNEESPLICDYLVVDEVSMIDVQLFYSLLKALPKNASLLLVGDVDQLPSVGAGQVLSDIINSNAIKTIKLTEVFRQAKTSDIIVNAHKINKGILPNLNLPKNKDTTKDHVQNHNTSNASDFYFIEVESGDDIINKIITMVSDRIPKRFNLDPLQDIQILCPMQRGGVGARSLNIELQKALNPNYEAGITKYGQIFAINDKVMQTSNDYDKEVYNGDMGIIKGINDTEQEVVITFDGKDITYDYTDLDQLTHSYATTIHKSQGSEYPAVIIPVTMQSYRMLKRNLIYTAITRAKKLVVIIGEKKALSIAVRNTKGLERYSKLRDWLLDEGGNIILAK